MKATGVVRRIDDLGRIVIPKEIRKTLRIKDGESVEIFLDDNNIVLKKYSPIEVLPDFYKEYVNAIYSEIGGNIFIVDRDKVVALAGELKKKYINKSISSSLDTIIQKRVVKFSYEKEKINLVFNTNENASYVIAPIITNGDAVGAVIILFLDDNIDDFIVKTGSIAAKFLGKYIE